MWNKYAYFILTIFFLLTQTFPPFNLIVPIGQAERIAVFVLGTFVLYPNLLIRKSVLLLMLYGGMAYFFHISGNAFLSSISSVIIPFFCMMSGLLLFEYADKYDKKFEFTKLVVYTVLCFNVVMAIISIPLLIENPNLIRNSESFIESDFSYFSDTIPLVISYDTMHGLPFLIAPLVRFCYMNWKKDNRLFLFSLITIFVLFVLIVMSNATTSLLLSIIMIILGFILRKEKYWDGKFFWRIGLFVLIFFVFTRPSIAVPTINTLQLRLNDGGASYHRLENIKNTIVYGESEGDLEVREERYNESSVLFMESPFLGTSHPEKIGRHSWIRDRLALFGIVFFVPLLLLFVTHIKMVYRSLSDSRIPYILGVMSYLLMLFLKNDFGTGTWMYAFGVLPLLCRYIDYIAKRNSQVDSI